MKWVKSKSSDYNNTQKNGDNTDDLIVITLRSVEKFTTHFTEYYDYPFDKLTFRYKFELSKLKFDGKSYCFDLYPTKLNSVSWKKDVDNLPELDLDFKKTCFMIKQEKSKMNDGTELRYFPGLTF